MNRFKVIALGIALVLAGCANADDTETKATPEAKASFDPSSYMATIQAAGKLRVGVKADIPQFGFLNPATNKFEGFDVDIAKEVAKRLDVTPEFSEAVSANRIPFLNEDKVDMVVSTFTINAERKQQIEFSVVYYVAGQSLLVKKDSKIKDVDSLDSQKGKVCSAKGSTSETNIRAAAPGAEVILQGAYGECFQLLRNNSVDAVSTDDIILLQFIAQDPASFKLTGGTFSREPYGIGIKKGRPEFVEFVSSVLSDIKADGTWKKIYDRWIKKVSGKDARPPEDDVTAEGPVKTSPSASPAKVSGSASPAR